MNNDIAVSDNPNELHKYLLHVVSISKKSFVVIGKILYHLKQEDKFKQAVGMGADTWVDYLKQPEIGLSVGEASRLMQIYEEFILRLGYDEHTISEVPVKNMHYLLPLVKKMKEKDDADDLVACATILSQKDFKEKIYDAKAEEMGAEATRTFEYLVMRKTLETNTMDKVMDISSDLIKRTFNLE